MLSPHDIHHGIILPLFLALVLLLPALIPRLRPRGNFVLLIALTVPFLLSFMHLFDRPPLPPVEITGWLFYLPIAAFLIGLIIEFSSFRLLALPVFFLSTTLILWPILRNENSFSESLTTVSFLAFVSYLSYLSLTQLFPRLGGRSMQVILFLLLAASAQVLMMSSSQTLGQTALILAAALFGSLPVVWCLKIPLTPGPLLLIVMLWHGFLIAGHFTANLTILNAFLLMIAPHGAWLGELRVRHWPRPARLALRFVAIFLPMLTAQLIAWRDFVEATREMQL